MSNGSTGQQPSAVVIKGSWQDLLTQAHRAAANQNDEAIALYEKVRNGLARLPEAHRQANDGKLHEIWEAAAANLHVYLTQRERYDESLDALSAMDEIVDEDEHKAWRQRRAMVLAQAGRAEEALDALQSLAEAPDARMSDWGNRVTQLVKLKRLDEATSVIAAAARWVQQAQTAGSDIGMTTAEAAAYLENLRSIVALVAGNYDEAIAHYEAACDHDAHYRERPELIYMRLLTHRQPGLALRWIERDTAHPVRATFWHGVALKRLGKPDEARRKWEQNAKAANQQPSNEMFLDLVMNFYYLGDTEGVGLNGVLRALQSGGAQSWLMLYLAGLGWLLRGNLNHARTNFALALGRRRAAAEGARLPLEVWMHCTDLLDKETQDQVAEYFETER